MIHEIALTLHSYYHSTSGNHSGYIYLLALLPLSGFLFYRYQLRRYRNRNRTYEYEHTSRAQIWNVNSSDQFVGNIHATTLPKVENYEQSEDPRRRVQPLP